MHRDMKPQNVLVSGDLSVVQIADMGLGREHLFPVEKLTHQIVTLWYRAPEILLGSKDYGSGVDIWSLGCIMGEMANIKSEDKFKAIFSANTELGVVLQIFMKMGTPTENNFTTKEL